MRDTGYRTAVPGELRGAGANEIIQYTAEDFVQRLAGRHLLRGAAPLRVRPRLGLEPVRLDRSADRPTGAQLARLHHEEKGLGER